ncbi:MAG: alpha/beta hydrolase [Bacteriovoracaceae bacterium]|nr:alpha/beta hydrolase [Bacteriovoracaceae bacterium]
MLNIFIHGNSGSPSNFQNIADRGDLMLTIPGHQGQEAPFACDLISLGQILGDEIRSHLPINTPYQLVAHSLGCNISVHAINFLKESGFNLPEKLILIAGPLLTTLNNLGSLFSSEPSGVIFTESNPLKVHIERAIILNNLKNIGLNQFIDGFKNTDPNFRERFIGSIGKGEFLNELEVLEKQGIPTHFLLGSKDPFINRENFIKQASQSPNFRFTLLEGLAHYPHLENPKLVKKTLLALNKETFHHQNLKTTDSIIGHQDRN